MYATTDTFPTIDAIETAAANADPKTGECMRKVVVFTNPNTGAQARRYRGTDHMWQVTGTSSAETLDVCVFCGTIA